MSGTRTLGFTAIAALLLVAPVFAAKKVGEDRGVLQQLARFAVTNVQKDFTQRGNRWYAACPFALGTYSYVELGDMRRSVHPARRGEDEHDPGVVERLELELHAGKARFYWGPGRIWKDYGAGPSLRYFAERHAEGGWTFEADQHVCARGEPQKKPALAEIPNG